MDGCAVSEFMRWLVAAYAVPAVTLLMAACAVVTFRDASGQVRVRTGAAGRFRARLAAGSWTVSPAASPATVIVRRGQTTRITVTTYVP